MLTLALLKIVGDKNEATQLNYVSLWDELTKLHMKLHGIGHNWKDGRAVRGGGALSEYLHLLLSTHVVAHYCLSLQLHWLWHPLLAPSDIRHTDGPLTYIQTNINIK